MAIIQMEIPDKLLKEKHAAADMKNAALQLIRIDGANTRSGSVSGQLVMRYTGPLKIAFLNGERIADPIEKKLDDILARLGKPVKGKLLTTKLKTGKALKSKVGKKTAKKGKKPDVSKMRMKVKKAKDPYMDIPQTSEDL